MVNEVIVFSIKPRRMVEVMAVNPRLVRFGLAVRRLRTLVPVEGWGISRRRVGSAVAIDRLHRFGKKVFVWTVNQEDEMRRFADWGADGLITNHPDRALAVLRGTQAVR